MLDKIRYVEKTSKDIFVSFKTNKTIEIGDYLRVNFDDINNKKYFFEVVKIETENKTSILVKAKHIQTREGREHSEIFNLDIRNIINFNISRAPINFKVHEEWVL